MPAKPVPYEQIRREVMTKRKLKPWEIVVARGHEEDVPLDEPLAAESPEATGKAMSDAVDPMKLAEKRVKIHEALAPIGDLANPESVAARKKKQQGSGLMNLLMSVMAR